MQVWGLGLSIDDPYWDQIRRMERVTETHTRELFIGEDEEDRKQIEELQRLRKAVERKRRREEIERLKKELIGDSSGAYM